MIFGGDDMKDETRKVIALTNVRTQIEAELLQDLLQQEEIAVMIKEPGSGGYTKLYMGVSLFGETLYVNDVDYPRAVELLAIMEQSGALALEDAQVEAFDDADAFDQYETEQVILAEQMDSECETGMQKNKYAAVLAIIFIFVLILYGVR